MREFHIPALNEVTERYATRFSLLPEEKQRFLEVSFDELGRLSIDEKILDVMNSKSSRHGKLLHFFEKNKSRLIEITELDKLLGRALYMQPFKDMKRDLGRTGYVMRYHKQRKGGYMYYGITLK
jgi:hypothetical protein